MRREILVADLSSGRGPLAPASGRFVGGAPRARALQPLIGGGSRPLRRNEQEFSSCGLPQSNCSINDVIGRPRRRIPLPAADPWPAKSSTFQDPSMSRQDANAAFARTSFLYGGNADYIENLYARYETDPNAVDAQFDPRLDADSRLPRARALLRQSRPARPRAAP